LHERAPDATSCMHVPLSAMRCLPAIRHLRLGLSQRPETQSNAEGRRETGSTWS